MSRNTNSSTSVCPYTSAIDSPEHNTNITHSHIGTFKEFLIQSELHMPSVIYIDLVPRSANSDNLRR